MARKAKGKSLTLMPIRVDEDVRAAILKLKAEHETINEGLRIHLLKLPPTVDQHQTHWKIHGIGTFPVRRSPRQKGDKIR